jgi:hypothetical protein
MDIIKLMETDISEKLSVRTGNILKRNGIDNIYTIIIYGKKNLIRKRGMGRLSFEELNNNLLSLGIDLDDKQKCEQQIKLYASEKINNVYNIVELIEKKCTSLDNEKISRTNAFNILSNNNYVTVYDILKVDKQELRKILNSTAIVLKTYDDSFFTEYGHLVIELLRYGINIEDSKYCNILLSYYYDEKEKNDESELNSLIKENNELQNTLDAKKNILAMAKEELLRKKQLLAKEAEYDRRFEALIAEYNALSNKGEKKYGTK